MVNCCRLSLAGRCCFSEPDVVGVYASTLALAELASLSFDVWSVAGYFVLFPLPRMKIMKLCRSNYAAPDNVFLIATGTQHAVCMRYQFPLCLGVLTRGLLFEFREADPQFSFDKSDTALRITPVVLEASWI